MATTGGERIAIFKVLLFADLQRWFSKGLDKVMPSPFGVRKESCSMYLRTYNLEWSSIFIHGAFSEIGIVILPP
jgi:hypothetical protein